jgi:hypothetical protein
MLSSKADSVSEQASSRLLLAGLGTIKNDENQSQNQNLPKKEKQKYRQVGAEWRLPLVGLEEV